MRFVVVNSLTVIAGFALWLFYLFGYCFLADSVDVIFICKRLFLFILSCGFVGGFVFMFVGLLVWFYWWLLYLLYGY